MSVQIGQELFHELTPLYFRYIHNVAHTMFHEASYMRQFHERKAPPILVYAMYALAERFSNHSHYHDIARGLRGKLGASAVESLIHQSIITPSLETVQALILIGYYYGGEGNTKAKHIYSGLARLHAEALGMPDIPKDATIMRQRSIVAHGSLSILPVIGQQQTCLSSLYHLHMDRNSHPWKWMM